MLIKDDTLKILYEDFLEWKEAYWLQEKQKWANITFIQWISNLIHIEEVIELSTQEEYQ